MALLVSLWVYDSVCIYYIYIVCIHFWFFSCSTGLLCEGLVLVLECESTNVVTLEKHTHISNTQYLSTAIWSIWMPVWVLRGPRGMGFMTIKGCNSKNNGANLWTKKKPKTNNPPKKVVEGGASVVEELRMLILNYREQCFFEGFPWCGVRMFTTAMPFLSNPFGFNVTMTMTVIILDWCFDSENDFTHGPMGC